MNSVVDVWAVTLVSGIYTHINWATCPFGFLRMDFQVIFISSVIKQRCLENKQDSWWIGLSIDIPIFGYVKTPKLNLFALKKCSLKWENAGLNCGVDWRVTCAQCNHAVTCYGRKFIVRKGISDSLPLR